MNRSERRALKPFKNRKETLLQSENMSIVDQNPIEIRQPSDRGDVRGWEGLNLNRQIWSSSIMDSWIKPES
jgi:hypothetical protein